jgi:hypothetical protein
LFSFLSIFSLFSFSFFLLSISPLFSLSSFSLFLFLFLYVSTSHSMFIYSLSLCFYVYDFFSLCFTSISQIHLPSAYY